MGKSTISMVIFNSFLLTFTRGYVLNTCGRNETPRPQWFKMMFRKRRLQRNPKWMNCGYQLTMRMNCGYQLTMRKHPAFFGPQATWHSSICIFPSHAASWRWTQAPQIRAQLLQQRAGSNSEGKGKSEMKGVCQLTFRHPLDNLCLEIDIKLGSSKCRWSLKK